MFVSADISVKAVMLGLAFWSALTWTVWLSRMMRATGRAVCWPVRHVWGIIGSRLHNTNLADVAPGIAQAPLATALGRAAAVPAVVIYHNFARAIASYPALNADASVEIVNHTSHDLSYAQIVDDGRVRAAVQAGAR
jgi:biopolymer transport protein ExbB/TolQ